MYLTLAFILFSSNCEIILKSKPFNKNLLLPQESQLINVLLLHDSRSMIGGNRMTSNVINTQK